MTHPAWNPDSVAVVTGGASGIGLAAAAKFAGMGMGLVIVDRAEDKLAAAESTLRAAGAADVMTAATDVSNRTEVEALEVEVTARFGGTDILMNNAGIGGRSSCLGAYENWQAMLGVNFQGAVNGTQVFAPGMAAPGSSWRDHQHRLQTRHHHPTRQPRLQCLQSGAQGLHRGAGP